ncbi:MAG: methyltransferase domain-containing protein [Spirochaetia bacterium]|nr:methyltransferase domain-containing protein [Spirochaetia bacterium]
MKMVENETHNKTTLNKTIKIEYNKKASSSCCLSCGGALELAKVKPNEIIIDLGSGRGAEVFKASEITGKNGFVYGVDFTDEMLNTAERTREKLNLSNIEFIKSDISEIPLKNEIADVVISNCVINHAPDKQKVFKEIFRVLKSNGRFVVSDVIADTELPDEVKLNPEAWAKCYGGAITKEEYFNAVANAGFNNIEVLEESLPYEKGEVLVKSITIRSIKKEKI